MYFSRTIQVKSYLLFLAILALGTLAACAPPAKGLPTAATQVGSKGDDIGELPTRAPDVCPGLDSTLYQISQADDPLRMAEELGMQVKDGRLQVLIELQDEDAGALKDFDIEITTQSKNLVQAFVVIDQLCDLAGLDNVTAIHPPPQASLD